MPRSLLLAAALLPCAAVAATLHVSPAGNDANPGTVGKPFATILRARDAIREMKSAGPLQEPVEVVMDPGTYMLAEPVVFTPADSGTARAPIVYRGARQAAWPAGPDAVISGGRRISGWKRDGPLFTATVPESREKGWSFSQLYVNGHRRTRARGPNTGAYFRPASVFPGSDARWGFSYAGDVFKRWDNLEDIVVVIFSSWFTTAHFIEKLDEAAGTVRFAIPGERDFDQYEPNPRYYIENAREYLDEPGEWFLDRINGRLLYVPLAGEAPDAIEAFAPSVRLPEAPPAERFGQLLHFRGEPERGARVEHLVFRDLAFRHTDAHLRKDIAGSRQAEIGRNAAIYARGLCHAVFERVEISNTGEHGVFLHDGSCSNTIRQCHLHDLGGGGILAGGNWRWGKGHPTYAGIARPEEIPPPVAGNVIDNNCIHDGGWVFPGIHGVWLGHASHHRVTHNEISDIPYSGISAGWDWTGKPSTARDNLIENNHIHRIGLGMLNDMAGIYTLGDSPGTTIRNNLIHNIAGYQSPVSYVVSAGIYLDMSTGHITVTNNVVHDVPNCGFFFHLNTAAACENNVFARFTHRGRGPKQLQDACVWAMFDAKRGETGSTFRNNILYGDVPSLFHLRATGFTGASPPVRIDDNWYRPPPGIEPVCTIDTGNARRAVPFAQWQAAGHDSRSLTGEPGFVDPLRNDFRLRPDAPARKLGIASIDTSRAGLYGDPAWKEMPRSFPPRKADPPTDYRPAPPKPLALDESFDDVKPGHVPANCEGPVAVIATGGGQSLRFTDRPGLERAWWPCRTFQDLAFAAGAITLSFDCLMPSRNPADFRVELRDWRGDLKTGPRIDFDAQGRIRAGRFTAPMPMDAWCRVRITFALGASATKGYTLSIACPGSAPVAAEVPFASPAFENLTWLGFLMPGEDPGAFFLDNLKFATTGSEKR